MIVTSHWFFVNEQIYSRKIAQSNDYGEFDIPNFSKCPPVSLESESKVIPPSSSVPVTWCRSQLEKKTWRSCYWYWNPPKKNGPRVCGRIWRSYLISITSIQVGEIMVERFFLTGSTFECRSTPRAPSQQNPFPHRRQQWRRPPPTSTLSNQFSVDDILANPCRPCWTTTP